MKDPKKQRYFYAMMAGFGTISLSVLFFFFLYRLQGIGNVISQLSTILAPFIYGGIIAYLLRPMCNSLEAFFQLRLPKKMRRFANAFAVVFSLMVGILVVYALITMVVPQLVESVVTLWNALPTKMEQLVNWATETFGKDERVVQFVEKNYRSYFTDIDKWVQANVIPQVSSLVTNVGTSVWQVLKFVYNILIGLIVAVYVLHGRKRFGKQARLIVRSIFSDRWADRILEEVEFIDRMFGGFIDGKIIDSAIVGVLCYIGCTVLKIPSALLVSVIVGVTNVIPFFGPVIGAVPSTLLILIDSPLKALWFLIWVIVLQQLDGNVIGPKILGNRTGLSGFWVMFSIILFGGLWGIVGMIICVPLFAVIYDTVRRLVRRGLRRRNHTELWDEYRAQFPDSGADSAAKEKKQE
ncbi:MAG: AI-2E family transporter [Clostridiales bacterium]|nr:AI-2E family transporter [Clostridiales bacterium]MDD7259006.1 AI-2E family transporter [Eubacteriales bacterium]MDY6067720.1 AI-2E family transporter [Candidatus Faecousia sp.]